LFPSFRGDSIRVKTECLVDLKRKFTQLDPNWTLKDFYNCPGFRILSYLDKLYIEEVNFVDNEILGLKILLEIRKMRAKNPSWRLNEKVMLQFLRANS
jgi:hypothetical protein